MPEEKHEMKCPKCDATEAFRLSSVLYARHDVENMSRMEKEELAELDTEDAVECAMCGHKDYMRNFLNG